MFYTEKDIYLPLYNNDTVIMETMILGVIGVPQLILIVLVLLLLFGGAKIPTLMKNLGKGINEFKKSTRGEYGDADDGKDAKNDSAGDKEK